MDQNVFSRSRYDSTDLHGQADLSKKNERWEARLKGNVNHDTTRTSEVSNMGLNVGSVRHFSYLVSPEIAFLPSLKDRLSLAASFEKNTYSNSAYSNYGTATLSPSYQRSLTPLTSGILSFQAQRFQTDRDPKKRVDSLGPTIGFLTELLPSLSLKGDVGAQASREKGRGANAEAWKWHHVFSSDLLYEDETSSLNLGASRARRPFGNGTDSLQTLFELGARRKLNEKLSLNAGANYRFADYEKTPGQSLDWMATGRAGAAYALTQDVSLTAGYVYRYERFTENYGTARENVVKIGVTLRHDWE